MLSVETTTDFNIDEESREDKLVRRAQTAVLRELLEQEELRSEIYQDIPKEDINARMRALDKLHEVRSLRAMAQLVVDYDLRYTEEPDRLTPEGMNNLNYKIASHRKDGPQVFIDCETTPLPAGSRPDLQRTFAVSIGGLPIEDGLAGAFASRALSVVELVKSKAVSLKERSSIRIPEPRTGKIGV